MLKQNRTYDEEDAYEAGRRPKMSVVAINDDARIDWEIGGGVSTIVWVRIPRIDRSDRCFALATAGALRAQGFRPAARYLKILQNRTHAIPGLQNTEKHGKKTLSASLSRLPIVGQGQ